MRAPRTVAIVALIAGALAAAPSPASAETLPEGALVAGVPVGGMGPIAARKEVQREVGARYEKRLVLLTRGRRRHPHPSDLGLTIPYKRMVERAFKYMRLGRPVKIPLALSIKRSKLNVAVRRIGRALYRRPRNARIRLGVTRIRIRSRGRRGYSVRTGTLTRAILRQLREPTDHRHVRVRYRSVSPAVGVKQLRRRYRTFISIDRSHFRLRLFKNLRKVKTYRIAVGKGGYATPRGLHRIISKQRNPAWHAPNRPWAGDLAGQTIPPGDPRNPLKAAFLAIGQGVGIHGTSDTRSIGHRASHGCIRMRIREVKRLYNKVPVGTLVLIR